MTGKSLTAVWLFPIISTVRVALPGEGAVTIGGVTTGVTAVAALPPPLHAAVNSIAAGKNSLRGFMATAVIDGGRRLFYCVAWATPGPM